MSGASPAATGASTPASAAWTAASAPIPFQRDADPGFPLGGAVLLVLLLAAALWAWLYGRTRGSGVRAAARAPAWAAWLRGVPAGAGELRVLETLQPAPGVRLMVVEWSGGKVLVGINGSAAPAALDRTETRAGMGTTESAAGSAR